MSIKWFGEEMWSSDPSPATNPDPQIEQLDVTPVDSIDGEFQMWRPDGASYDTDAFITINEAGIEELDQWR